MKRLSFFLLSILAVAPALLQANPFRTRFVCVPTVAPDQLALDFKIRDSGQCSENERYLEVLPQSDGSVLLMPVQDSLSSEEKQDVERYRKYFGGEGEKAN